MKIGSQAHRSSAISSSNEDTILVRGRDLCGELIGHVTFTDHIWLLVTGQLPNDMQRRMLDATLVAIAEHGLVRRCARSAAGRGRRGNSRLRLGDPRRVAERRASAA